MSPQVAQALDNRADEWGQQATHELWAASPYAASQRLASAQQAQDLQLARVRLPFWPPDHDCATLCCDALQTSCCWDPGGPYIAVT